MNKSAYQDLWFRLGGSLLASHLIEALGRPESLFEPARQPSYYVALLIVLINLTISPLHSTSAGNWPTPLLS